MLVSDIIRHLGHYCQVTTQNRQIFGELIRLSGSVFAVRFPSSGTIERTVEARDIIDITDLSQPHL